MVRIALSLVLVALAVRAVAGEVRLTVAEPSGVARQGWPVTSGVPFAQGALKAPDASALFDADGRELPLQTEALATWPDGSVRWLLLDFQIDLAANGKKVLTLRHGRGAQRSPVDKPLRAHEADGDVVVEAGGLRLGLDQPEGPAGPGRLWIERRAGEDGGTVAAGGAISSLVDAAGSAFFAGSGDATQIVLEQSGPLRACIRVEGSYGSDRGEMFRYVIRIHAFRGQPFLRLCHTFINDGQRSLMARVRSIGLTFRVPEPAAPRPYSIVGGSLEQGARNRSLLQIDERCYEVDGQAAGQRAPGWGAIGSDAGGLAVGLREFWQNWPKGIQHKDGQLHLALCPEFARKLYAGKPIEEENKLTYHLRDGLHTFKVGVAKTHELWATFYKGKPDVERLSAFFRAAEEPLLPTCEPAYVDATKVYGDLPPADPEKYAGYDAWLSRALDSHLKLRDKTREYGMLNYGDWYGERRVNWGNLEYDLQHGLFLQYLRTGDRRFFLRAEQAARHHIDVDVVHATNPHLKNPWAAAPQVGEIWLHALNHTGGYYDEKTSGLPVSRTYHLGHSTNFGHVWVTGDLDYYYLTGDRRARDVALQIADAMLRHIPNRYGTHIRTLGWPTIICLAAYDLTRDKKYLDGARKNWEVLKKNIDWEKGWVIRLAKGHCLHPDRRCHGNVPFMEGMVLCALARYHRVTKDPEVLRAITVGIDQMIRECWQEDVKTFRYTACPLSSKAPYCLFVLSAEAMAYEIAHTGNVEHLRILREGLRAAIPKGDGYHHGKSLGQMIFFTPHALRLLED